MMMSNPSLLIIKIKIWIKMMTKIKTRKLKIIMKKRTKKKLM